MDGAFFMRLLGCAESYINSHFVFDLGVNTYLLPKAAWTSCFNRS
jgi:hypothetical protein